MGVSEEAAMTEEAAPSFAESWRIVWKIETLRRIWIALPFLAAALIGFASLAGLRLFRLAPRPGGVTRWENHELPGTTASVVELPAGSLAPAAVRRLGRATIAVAAGG
jgi:hypothetical protein